jgi:hypothetical protein
MESSAHRKLIRGSVWSPRLFRNTRRRGSLRYLRKLRNSLSLFAAALLLPGSSTVYGQEVYRMSLDSVSGLHNVDTIYTSQQIVFYLRLSVNSPPGKRVIGLWNAFRVYSPTGAQWLGTNGAYTDAITPAMLEYRLTRTYSVDGSGSDTIGFLGAGTFFSACGIPESFDEVSMEIGIGPIDTLFQGQIICLDSVMLPSREVHLGDWGWWLGFCDAGTDSVAPGWSGPHCFTVTRRPCPVVATGDVNLDNLLTSSDIIGVVNYVFKSGAEPQPCPAAADADCSGATTSADVIHLVDHVFKGGPTPCNVCALIWSGQWSCP